MANAGMDVKVLQYVMGHSEIDVTMNVYTHMGFESVSYQIFGIALPLHTEGKFFLTVFLLIKTLIQLQVERFYNRWYDKTNRRYIHYRGVSAVALSQEVRK